MKCRIHLLIAAVLAIVSTNNCGGLNYDNPLQAPINSLLAKLKSTPMDAILYWNFVTLQACANDYDASIAPTPDNLGPTETSRAFAIIHGAMYEAMAVFNQGYKPLFRPNGMPNIGNVHKQSAVNAAIMEAAYQTLRAMYPQQQAIFDAVRKQYRSQLKNDGNKRGAITIGIRVGQLISAFILASRQNDNSEADMSYTPILLPGYHRADPTHPDQGFLTPTWGSVTPFLLNSGSQFRPANVVGDTPVARLSYLGSTRHTRDFNEVKAYGAKNSTVRSADQTEIGIFWAYDAAPKIGVPVRLYNQVVRVIAIQEKNTLEENARLFALVNYALGDAGIAAWDCKYYYNFWRPIVGIRQAIGSTQRDPNWLPLGSQADGVGTDFTPPFPSYVSGHSTFGSATFESLRLFYKTDNIEFQFQSDEFNGQTIDSNTGRVRPAKTRHYQSFTEAEIENFLSRIYLGVHWRSDQEEGKTLGRNIAQFAYQKFY